MLEANLIDTEKIVGQPETHSLKSKEKRAEGQVGVECLSVLHKIKAYISVLQHLELGMVILIS